MNLSPRQYRLLINAANIQSGLLDQNFISSELDLKKFSDVSLGVPILIEADEDIFDFNLKDVFNVKKQSILKIISQITNIKNLIGDPELYAGGVSSMSKGCFLNPHIDNSHDRNLENYRRLNLLYYVNKNWTPTKDGGELVLFPNGIKDKEEEIGMMNINGQRMSVFEYIKNNKEQQTDDK